MAPVSWNGANTLYHRVIKPFVLKHQTQIDKALDKVGQKVDEVAKEGIKPKHFKGLKLAKKQLTVFKLPSAIHSVFAGLEKFVFINVLFCLHQVNTSITTA